LFELSALLRETPPEELRTENGFVVAQEASISFADVLNRNHLEELEESGEYSTPWALTPRQGKRYRPLTLQQAMNSKTREIPRYMALAKRSIIFILLINS
jgi:hypothetical protein